jgi:hypothetical protein
MKTLDTLTPPGGPTEQELRLHFAETLPTDAKLMRPEYTTIWALEDGTLLWDWKNGYADLSRKAVMPNYQDVVTKLKAFCIRAARDPESVSDEELERFHEFERFLNYQHLKHG